MPQEAFSKLPVAKRIELTQEARAAGVPLTQRWRELDLAVSEQWCMRAKAAAPLLADAQSVADLGCGHMLLESCLRPSQGYVPVDLVARDSRTIVTDFNAELLPKIAATHFAALGLLEYLYRLDDFLCQLSQAFTSGVASFFARRDVLEDARLANGWVNHQTEDEIRDLFRRSGFMIQHAVEWQPAHWLFRLDSLR